MTVAIADPVLSTWIVAGAVLLALIASARARRESGLFSQRLTQEVKGFAILAIIFSHTGYFLVTDHQFLFPLSILAGVGVNIFLFLSGFGLTMSALARERKPVEFYLHHLPRLFIPLWITLGIFLALDFFVLDLSYGWQYIAQSLAGFFPHADLYTDIDSPLWYLTLALFYYIVFPLFFSTKRPWLSAILVYAVSELAFRLAGHALDAVAHLYAVHLFAFPLGMMFAWLLRTPSPVARVLACAGELGAVARYCLLAALAVPACYFAYFSGVGDTVLHEQTASLVVVALVVLIFMIKRTDFGVLYVFGLYSYEIYLLHWPLLYRYDILYARAPAWLATILYLFVFIALAYTLRHLSNFLIRPIIQK
ncbi:MAG: acyltransferase family protein [bacterium]|nr:acyltransferase family protein [bacterium]